MTDIFFSYSSKDRERVARAHKTLTDRGFQVFWDLQVPPATDWDRWIKARLDQSRCVVVFWTANSLASKNVRHEVDIAREDEKLIQVFLEPLATRDLPMGLLAEQAVRLMDWKGEPEHPEWLKLVDAIEARATPEWMRERMRRLELAAATERKRVAEADQKIRLLEDAHEAEIKAQVGLRRERDRLLAERVAKKTAAPAAGPAAAQPTVTPSKVAAATITGGKGAGSTVDYERISQFCGAIFLFASVATYFERLVRSTLGMNFGVDWPSYEVTTIAFGVVALASIGIVTSEAAKGELGHEFWLGFMMLCIVPLAIAWGVLLSAPFTGLSVWFYAGPWLATGVQFGVGTLLVLSLVGII